MTDLEIMRELGFTVGEQGKMGRRWSETTLDSLPPTLRDVCGDELVRLMRETGRPFALFKVSDDPV